MDNAGRRTDFWDQTSSDIFWRAFFWRGISGAALLPVQLCSHQCLWSGFIFPELEHLYKNVFTASFPKRSVGNLGCSFVSKKRTRSGSNVSSQVGKDQLSIHFTRLLDDLKSSKNYCPNCPRKPNRVSGSPRRTSTIWCSWMVECQTQSRILLMQARRWCHIWQKRCFLMRGVSIFW